MDSTRGMMSSLYRTYPRRTAQTSESTNLNASSFSEWFKNSHALLLTSPQVHRKWFTIIPIVSSQRQ